MRSRVLFTKSSRLCTIQLFCGMLIFPVHVWLKKKRGTVNENLKIFCNHTELSYSRNVKIITSQTKTSYQVNLKTQQQLPERNEWQVQIYPPFLLFMRNEWLVQTDAPFLLYRRNAWWAQVDGPFLLLNRNEWWAQVDAPFLCIRINVHKSGQIQEAYLNIDSSNLFSITLMKECNKWQKKI